MRTLICNGLIIRENGVFYGDVLMDEGRILELGEHLPRTSTGLDVVDATDCLVMPGGVDVHTHLALTVGQHTVNDGFAAGTLAAAWGGTTTIVEHPGFGPAGCAPDHQINAYRALAAGQAHVDYAFHGVLQQVNDEVLNALPHLVQGGVPSVKAYMTYDGRLDDDDLLAVLEALGKVGGLLTVHAENHAITQFMRHQLEKSERTAPTDHPKSRPALCEAEAVNRIIALAHTACAPLYLVHISTKAALDPIRHAKNLGLSVLAETCPQYLVLTDERYADDDGLQYVMAPPLRTQADRMNLWEALANGTLDVVATDHCAFSLAQKVEAGQTNVFHTPGGVAGVETRLPILFTEGVLTSRLTLPRFVQVCATNPANIMGLPTKGRLTPGADADVVVLDPALERVVSPKTLHQSTDCTPFAGRVVRGWPRHVWLRGQALISNHEHTASAPLGQEVLRHKHRGE